MLPLTYDEPFERRWHASRRQLLAILGLMALPLLGLLKVFDTVYKTVSADGPLHMEMRYPAHTRFGERLRWQVTVRNGADVRSAPIRLAFDEDYLASFTNISTSLPTALHSAGAWHAELTPLLPGGRHVLIIEAEARGIGSKRGSVEIRTDGEPAASLPVTTFILP